MALQQFTDIGQDPRESFTIRPRVGGDQFARFPDQANQSQQLQNFGQTSANGQTFKMNPETGASMQVQSPQTLPAMPSLTPEQQARQNAIAARIAGGEAVGTGASPLIQQQQNPLEQLPFSTQAETDTMIALGGGDDAAKLIREARQQQTIRDSGAKAASDKLVESLREQGVSDDVIKGAVSGSKTNSEQFTALNRLNRKEATKRARGKASQRITDKLTAKERRNEDGTAKNDAAMAVDFDDFFSDSGDDPLSDKSNYDFLTKSQQREYERYRSQAANGRVTNNATRRIAKFQKDVDTKRKRDFETKQAKIVSDTIAERKDASRSKQETQFYIVNEKRLKLIKDRLDKSFTRKEKEDGGLQDQLREQQKQIMSDISGGFKQPVQSERKVMGEKKDSNGNVIQVVYSDGTIEDV